ncbi:hypothetical protein HY988_00900 [Candidatus Micrarchaeota archaeon]|nr:hypothetical protein [Candidatus Micrarchaeota archaeon]
MVDQERRFKSHVASRLAEDIAWLRQQGKEVLLVSSGAVALGKRGNEGLKRELAAGKGQRLLMEGWAAAFAPFGLDVCQVLVNENDSIDFSLLMQAELQAIINGNDLSCITNNDLIASAIATRTQSDLLVLLTDVDGYLDGEKRRIEYIDIKSISLASASTDKNCFGTGGICTKLQAMAETTATFGIIANGQEVNILGSIISGEDRGTLFTRGG